MNWHTGNIADAVQESKAKDAIFVVYIDGQNEMSAKLERFVDDRRVCERMNTSDFVAIKIQGDSMDYAQFMSVYKVVPIPSIFFIGKSGTPLGIATGITASVEELVAKVDRVLQLAGKRQQKFTFEKPSTSSCHIVDKKSRTIAGADEESDESAERKTEPNENKNKEVESAERKTETDENKNKKEDESTPYPPTSTADGSEAALPSPKDDKSQQPADQSVVVPTPETRPIVEPTLVLSPPITTREVKPLSVSRNENSATSPTVSFHPAATTPSGGRGNTATPNLMPTVIPLLPTISAIPQGPQAQGRPLTDSELRVTEVQRILEEKKLERLAEEQRRERDEQAKEQEIKAMQERIRRERQEEQDNRDRIRNQIAADRAELSRRVALMSAEVKSTTSTATTLGASSLSSIEETRLQIRLPGGIHRTKSFPAEELLSTVRVYVRQELLPSSNTYDFTLATSYPHREFQYEDELKTLNELNLVPNAVVLVLKKEQINRISRTGGSIMSMLATVVWALLTPAAKAFDYINKMGIQRLAQKLSNMLAHIGWLRPLPQAGSGGEVVLVPGDAATARRNMDMFVLRPMPTAPGQQQAPTTTAPLSAAAAAKTEAFATPLSKENAVQMQASKERINQQPQQALGSSQVPPNIQATSS